MHRRQFLAAGAGTAAATLAGCRSLFETRSSRVPPLVDDRPDAVYYPTHVEGMQMVGTTTAGDYTVALTYSFPHRFWQIDVDEANKVDIADDDTLHLMTTVWDEETGTVIPNDGMRVSISADGEAVASGRLWAMLSQNMSVHAGDNFSLDGDGTYDVEVSIDPVSDRTTGAFADRFADLAAAAFTLDFSESTLDETEFRRLDDREGDRGAVEPMEMEMVPVATTPAPGDLPGRPVGEPKSGDAVFATTVLDSPPTGVDGDGAYLAVSARTPYNAYPLPMLSLSATLDRGDETPFDGSLTPTLDPDLGYHYGAAIPSVESGDDLALTVDAPPQISRHEGYETAFLGFETMSLTV